MKARNPLQIKKVLNKIYQRQEWYKDEQEIEVNQRKLNGTSYLCKQMTKKQHKVHVQGIMI